MMKSLILIALLTVATTAHAYKLVLLTDEPGAKKALAIKALIASTSPFKFLSASEFSVEVQSTTAQHPVSCHSKVIKYTSSEVAGLEIQARHQGFKLSKEQKKKFRDGYTIDRLVECDRQALAEIGAGFGASRVLFVHKSPFEGGSGGDIPVILSGSSPGVGMHEWLHTFGLADEYAYSAEEAAMYCNKARWINVAIFDAGPSYSGNADVVAQHSDVISWLSGLPSNSLLTSAGQLGSPYGSRLGIFPSKTCDNLSPRRQSWRATSYPSIMENQDVPYVPKPWWPALLSGMGVGAQHLSTLMMLPDPLDAGLTILKDAHPQPEEGQTVH